MAGWHCSCCGPMWRSRPTNLAQSGMTKGSRRGAYLRGGPAVGVLGHHADDHETAALGERSRARCKHFSPHALPDQVHPLCHRSQYYSIPRKHTSGSPMPTAVNHSPNLPIDRLWFRDHTSTCLLCKPADSRSLVSWEAPLRRWISSH